MDGAGLEPARCDAPLRRNGAALPHRQGATSGASPGQPVGGNPRGQTRVILSTLELSIRCPGVESNHATPTGLLRESAPRAMRAFLDFLTVSAPITRLSTVFAFWMFGHLLGIPVWEYISSIAIRLFPLTRSSADAFDRVALYSAVLLFHRIVRVLRFKVQVPPATRSKLGVEPLAR